MIDTIKFRLHNINQKHRGVYELLNVEKKSKGSMSKFLKVVDRKEVEHRSPYYAAKYMRYGMEKEKFMGLRGTLYIPSSNYELGYWIETERNYIEFEFSIPKFLYGNNIAQFIINHKNKNFDYTQHISFKNQAERLYDRLLFFIIQKFFGDNFIDIPIDCYDIEILRIDICFNQLFDTEYQCRRYLEKQKLIYKKFQRFDTKKIYNYKSSIMFLGEGYTFKIYHKGDEFQKNDALKLQANNEKIAKIDEKNNDGYRQKRKYVNTDKMQDFANRILRYEVTFKNSKISQLFNEKILAGEKSKKLYSEIRSKMEKNSRMYDTFYAQNSDNIDLFELHSSLYKITDFEKEFYDEYKQAMVMRRSFRIPEPGLGMGRESKGNLIRATGLKHLPDKYVYKNQYFSPRLLGLMLSLFYDHLKTFQPEIVEGTEKILEKIKEKNDNSSKKIRLSAWRIFLENLERYKSLDEIKKLNIYNKRTLQRYAKQLHEFYGRKVVIDKMNLVREPDISFKDYLVEMNDKGLYQYIY